MLLTLGTYRVQWGFLSQLVTLKGLVVYRTVYILSEEENLPQPVTTINVKRTPLSQSGNNSLPAPVPGMVLMVTGIIIRFWETAHLPLP